MFLAKLLVRLPLGVTKPICCVCLTVLMTLGEICHKLKGFRFSVLGKHRWLDDQRHVDSMLMLWICHQLETQTFDFIYTYGLVWRYIFYRYAHMVWIPMTEVVCMVPPSSRLPQTSNQLTCSHSLWPLRHVNPASMHWFDVLQETTLLFWRLWVFVTFPSLVFPAPTMRHKHDMYDIHHLQQPWFDLFSLRHNHRLGPGCFRLLWATFEERAGQHSHFEPC